MKTSNSSGKAPKYQDALLNAYLSLSRETASLKDFAYARIILWVLYMEDNYLDINSIVKEVAQVIDTLSVPRRSVEAALNLPAMKKILHKQNDKWALISSEKDAISKKLTYSTNITEKILRKHFPSAIEYGKLLQWFDETNKKYFSEGAERLISLYNIKEKPIHNLESIVCQTIKEYKLDKYQKELIQGYIEFITSEEREEEEKVFALMNSLLSTKIVSADLSPDILNIEKYRGATVILDTNVLLSTKLFYNEDVDAAILSLGKVFSSLNIKLCIADYTIEEYEKVVSREKENYLKLWNTYPFPIISKMYGKDGFSRSILRTGCKTIEDIERFFGALKLPDKIGELPIEAIDHKLLSGSEYNEVADKELFENIRKIMYEFSGHPKPIAATIHDVCITKLVKKLSKTNNVFVLTTDRTMETLSMREISDKEDPYWRSLDSLIRILAINGGGPEYDPSELAPLVKIFMDFEVIGSAGNYDKRDLLLLSEKTNRIKELPESKAISILNQIHKARMLHDEQGIFEVTLELERTLRLKDEDVNQAIREKDSKISELSEQLEQSADEIKNLKIGLNKMKNTWLWIWYFIKSFVAFILCYLLYVYLFKELEKSIQLNDRYHLIEVVLKIIAPIVYMIKDYFDTRDKLEKL